VDIHHASGRFLISRDEDGGKDLLDGVVEGLPLPAVLDGGPGGALREGGREGSVRVVWRKIQRTEEYQQCSSSKRGKEEIREIHIAYPPSLPPSLPPSPPTCHTSFSCQYSAPMVLAVVDFCRRQLLMAVS
jgi:hypothetical protein